MDIEFDPAKDAVNIPKHRLSLADAVEMDLATAAVVLDDRYDYAEVRYRAFGRMTAWATARFFTRRADRVRIISFRRAHDEEMARHGR